MSLSSDGNTLAVGARRESSNGVGVNSGAESDNSMGASGAVYLFRFTGGTWTQEAYLKASNAGKNDYFGEAVSLSSDGNTLAVGARRESSNGAGVNSGAEADNSTRNAGAVYIFRFTGGTWAQEAYLKASNSDESDQFGSAVSLSSDSHTLAVGSPGEDSNGVGVNSGGEADNSASYSGAVYLFRFTGGTWVQEAYLKASNAEEGDSFGEAVSLSSDGNTLAVGGGGEGSNGAGGSAEADNSASGSGAAYLFRFTGGTWVQEAYLKASNAEEDDSFGDVVSLSSDGNTLAVGARRESSDGVGVNSGAEANNSASASGAVYVY
ncbi:hypothetical protein VCRA2110O176_480014 [Vibrio crassostreae]|nr:hypothetical protein VCRA2110O176_480014 [Vibrio crassostreae]CAK3019342.1 hypothetical protein VCRA2113O229_520014 [Vibrio crassostreae]